MSSSPESMIVSEKENTPLDNTTPVSLSIETKNQHQHKQHQRSANDAAVTSPGHAQAQCNSQNVDTQSHVNSTATASEHSGHEGSRRNDAEIDYLLSINRGNPTSDPRNLIVNYIPTPVTSEELHRLFAPFGEIEAARIIHDKGTNHPRGFGFVCYKNEESAREAIRAMNGYEIQNKRLRVTQANGPMSRTSGGGDGGTGGGDGTGGGRHNSTNNSSNSAPTSAHASSAQLNIPAYSSAPVFTMSPAPVVVSSSYPSYATTSQTFAIVPAPTAGPTIQLSPAPVAPQQVYFAATPIPGGYQLNPQPLTFVVSGGTIFAQAAQPHSPTPTIYVATATPTTNAHHAHAQAHAQPQPTNTQPVLTGGNGTLTRAVFPHSVSQSTRHTAGTATSPSAGANASSNTNRNSSDNHNANTSATDTTGATNPSGATGREGSSAAVATGGATMRPLSFTPYNPPVGSQPASVQYSLSSGPFSVGNSAASIEHCAPSGYVMTAPTTFP